MRHINVQYLVPYIKDNLEYIESIILQNLYDTRVSAGICFT